MIYEDARLNTDEFVIEMDGISISAYLSDAVYEKNLNSVWNVHPHNHRDFEIHYINKGSIKLKYQNDDKSAMYENETELHSGDFCMIKPAVYHSVFSNDVNIHKISFNFDYQLKSKAGIAESFDGLFGEADNVTIFREARELGDLLLEIFNVKTSKIPNFVNYERKTLLTLVFLKILERLSSIYLFQAKTDVCVKQDLSESAKRRYKVELFLDAALGANEEIRLENLADYLALSPKQTTRVLKKEYGKTFSMLVSEFRVQNAKELLKNDTISIEKVSEMVGYETPSGFIHTFKRLVGMTPLEYRKFSQQHN